MPRWSFFYEFREAYPIISRFGRPGRRAIVAATGGTLLTDTASLLVLVILVQLASDGGAWSWLTPIVLLVLLAVIALLVIPRLAEAVLSQAKHTLSEKAMFLLAVIVLLSTAADLIGAEDILGALPGRRLP